MDHAYGFMKKDMIGMAMGTLMAGIALHIMVRNDRTRGR